MLGGRRQTLIGAPIGAPLTCDRVKTTTSGVPSVVVALVLWLEWYRIPESRQTSGGFRLRTVVTVGSGQLR